MAGKKHKVRFLVPCSYGFKHDTPGHEASDTAQGGKATTSLEFAVGDEYEFPVEEQDVIEGLLADGICVPS